MPFSSRNSRGNRHSGGGDGSSSSSSSSSSDSSTSTCCSCRSGSNLFTAHTKKKLMGGQGTMSRCLRSHEAQLLSSSLNLCCSSLERVAKQNCFMRAKANLTDTRIMQ